MNMELGLAKDLSPRPQSADLDFGKKPELAWLPVDLLSSDHAYQRTIESLRSRSLIARICAGFQWSSFGAVIVTKATKGWRIIDGQHRVEAARRLGLELVPALTIELSGTREEAAAFVHANSDRVAVNVYALHYARLAAGDPAAECISDVVGAVGISIPRYPEPTNKIAAGKTLAIGSIVRIIKRHGQERAIEIMTPIADAYREEPGGVAAIVIDGVAALLSEDGSFPGRQEITNALRKSSAAALIAEAGERKRRYGGTNRSSLTHIVKTRMQLAAASPPANLGLMMAGR